jgi:hypothetical protein
MSYNLATQNYVLNNLEYKAGSVHTQFSKAQTLLAQRLEDGANNVCFVIDNVPMNRFVYGRYDHVYDPYHALANLLKNFTLGWEFVDTNTDVIFRYAY